MLVSVEVDDLVIKKALSGLTEYGFGDFCFIIIAKDHNFNKNIISMRNLDLKIMNKQKYIISSSRKALNLWEMFFSYYAKYDERVRNKKITKGHRLWPGVDVNNKTGGYINEVFMENNVNSIVSSVIDISDDLLGSYTLLSENSRDKTNEMLKHNSQELDITLKLFAQYFSCVHMAELNPVQNFNGISEKSIVILKLLARGKTLEEMSSELHLTKRGVVYHIEKLKNEFACNNRNELVDKSHKLGLL